MTQYASDNNTITSTLTFDIQQTDLSGNTNVDTSENILAFISNVAIYSKRIKAANLTGYNPSLPIIPSYQLYIKNIDTLSNVIVKLDTPTSGGPVQVAKLYPGEVFILWQQITPENVDAGFSALTLISNVAVGTLVELYIGA